VGNITLYDIDHDRRQAELGIMIGNKSYWARGLGNDAIITLLHEVFYRSDLRRIYLHTLDWNKRARSAFAKAGFREVGWTHENRHRFVEMEVLRESFLGQFNGYLPSPEPPPLPGKA
jgi:RimJ/RimL family protein N-acetyltransferase